MVSHVYVLYILICLLQLPLFLTLYSLGYQAYFNVLEPRPELQIKNASMLMVFAKSQQKFNAESGCMFAVAGWYAVLYLLLRTTSEETELCTDDSALHLMDENLHFKLQFQRVCFWLFMWLQGVIFSIHTLNFAGKVMETLWFTNALRCIALYGLCRTSTSEKRSVAQACTACVYLWWVISCIEIGVLNYTTFSIQILFLDGILILGHMWDPISTTLVVLNCRLFFVASTSMMMSTLDILTLHTMMNLSGPR